MKNTISDVARQLHCSVGSLRRWQKDGLIPEPGRSPGNWRLYTIEDIMAIKRLLRKGKEGG